jgi:hypothetical protein
MTELLDALLLDLLNFPVRINGIATDVGVLGDDDTPVFKAVTVKQPIITGCNEGGELAFLQTISWLYVLYKEAGRDTLGFVLAKSGLYKLNEDRYCENHIRLIDRMRTYFQHNLNPNRKEDRLKTEDVEGWFTAQSGGSFPADDTLWLKCLHSITCDAHKCLEIIESILKSIEADEFRDVIIEDWKQKNRLLQPHELDPLVQEVAAEIGRDDLMDIEVAIALRKKNERDWLQSLKLVTENKDQKEEARKLIFATIVGMARRHPLLPSEIAERFNIPAGDSRLDKLGRIALDIWMSEPCSGAELLEKLAPLNEKKL